MTSSGRHFQRLPKWMAALALCVKGELRTEDISVFFLTRADCS